MRKKTVALLLLLAAFLGLGARAYAAEVPDETRPGSLVIQIEFESEPLEGGALTICRVGRIAYTGGDAGFALIDALSGGPALDRLDDPALAASLAELAAQRDLPVVRAEIEKGRAEFTDLEPGLYVVIQREQDAADGFAPIQPFLLSLPQWIDGMYVYDLTAAPKVPLQTEPTEPTEPSTEPTEPGPDTPDLPQTGQLNWPVPILTVLGLVLFTAGWILCFRSRRDSYEA